MWHVNKGEAALHSHRFNSSKIQSASGYACNAVWYDPKTVLTSGNDGAIGLYTQDFEA